HAPNVNGSVARLRTHGREMITECRTGSRGDHNGTAQRPARGTLSLVCGTLLITDSIFFHDPDGVRMTARVPVLAAMACVAVLAVSGCGDSATSDSGDGLSVAASTGAWASVARAIGGGSVHVSAVNDGPGADPHPYQSTAAGGLSLPRADLAVVSGGGYDSSAEGLADQAPDVPVIDAFALSGHEAPEHEEAGHEHDHAHEHGGVNEHVWYDLHVVEQVADELVERLSKLAP